MTDLHRLKQDVLYNKIKNIIQHITYPDYVGHL